MHPLPPQPTGRNRPASVGGIPLTWDANGNLTSKGDRHFEYDFRNRLTRVSDGQGVTVATYLYDAMNRRVDKSLPDGTSLTTVWSGWQSVEDRVNDQPRGIRVYGSGLDELVLSESDLSGDGYRETAYQPLYDAQGNIVTLTGPQGQLVASALYQPFGQDPVWRVDSVAPAVEHLRLEGGSIVLETSEELAKEALGQAETNGGIRVERSEVASGASKVPGSSLSNVSAATTLPVSVSFTQPVELGRNARRRLVLTPETAPSPGDTVTVTVEPSALRDLFLNQASSAYTFTFTWPESSSASLVLEDTTPPEVDFVGIHEGHLLVEMSETQDLLTVASAILVDGGPITWTIDADG